jgi:hypothetical protein
MYKMVIQMPDEIEAKARERLEEVRNLHRDMKTKDLALLANDPKVTGDAVIMFEKLAAERAKRITLQNLIKSVLYLSMDGEFPAKLVLHDMAERGAPMGRPVAKPVVAAKGRKLRVVGSRK